MTTVRFAKAFDSDGKEIAVFVDGGNRDAMDAGYLQGSYSVEMSDKQFARLATLVSQEQDGSEIPYEVRPYGNGVRIYEF